MDETWTWTDITLIGSTVVEETDEFSIPEFEGLSHADFDAMFGRAADYGLIEDAA